MPAPVSDSLPVFPPLRRADVDACRLSHWYDTFEDLTVPSSVIDIRALGEGAAFLHVSGARRGVCRVPSAVCSALTAVARLGLDLPPRRQRGGAERAPVGGPERPAHPGDPGDPGRRR